MNKEEIINKLKYFLNFEAIQINKIEVIEIINLIKDIEQEIEELKQEKNQFKEYTNHNYDEGNKKQQRIDKAIEYIEENKNKTYAPYGDNEDYDYEICLDKDEIKCLLEILKGSDEE